MDIVEAPISDVQFLGDPQNDVGGSYGKTDKKLFSSPKGIEKIVRAFARTPFNFEVFFVNWAGITNSDTENEMVDDYAGEWAGIYDEFHGIDGKPGVIRVMQLSNLSPLENKRPMNGWTLAHKIGHSIQDDLSRSGWNSPLGRIVSQINTLLMIIEHAALGIKLKPNRPFTTFVGGENLRWRLTMKSARDGQLTNEFEVFAEIVAQYLVQGRVTMNLNDAPDNTAAEHLEELNHTIEQMFKMLVGKVMVEV